MHGNSRLPITVIVAVKNEQANIKKCLASLSRVERVIVVDSNSTDATVQIAEEMGAEVHQFVWNGGHPKKRQWSLDNILISSTWVLLLDADEVVPDALWEEISLAIGSERPASGFLIRKGFHFLGKRFRHGGFSHSAVLLFQNGRARFEQLFEDNVSGLDMEVHERLIIRGRIESLRTAIIHEDFKGLEAYIHRHNKYSSWEAALRRNYLLRGQYGDETIQPSLIGNSQERRRALKAIIIRLPFEPQLWFLYHFIFRLGFLEGRRGLIACQIRGSYISQVRAKNYESKLHKALDHL